MSIVIITTKQNRNNNNDNANDNSNDNNNKINGRLVECKHIVT